MFSLSFKLKCPNNGEIEGSGGSFCTLPPSVKVRLPLKNKLLDILNCSSGKNWFSENINSIDWSKESYSKENTIGILEKDVNSYLDGLKNTKSDVNEAMDNFQKALLDGLANLPKYPRDN